jgi:hypothetical protein
MQISPPARRLLKLVFSASSAQGSITRPRLERRSGLSAQAVQGALEELARLGMLDALRLRLTLSGLALAVACGARTRAARRFAARGARPPSALNTPIALFSLRERARAVA